MQRHVKCLVKCHVKCNVVIESHRDLYIIKCEEVSHGVCEFMIHRAKNRKFTCKVAFILNIIYIYLIISPADNLSNLTIWDLGQVEQVSHRYLSHDLCDLCIWSSNDHNGSGQQWSESDLLLLPSSVQAPAQLDWGSFADTSLPPAPTGIV